MIRSYLQSFNKDNPRYRREFDKDRTEPWLVAVLAFVIGSAFIWAYTLIDNAYPTDIPDGATGEEVMRSEGRL